MLWELSHTQKVTLYLVFPHFLEKKTKKTWTNQTGNEKLLTGLWLQKSLSLKQKL